MGVSAILDEILATVRKTPRATLVFDLDSTLLDNRPRQSRILREYGVANGLANLAASRPWQWGTWDLRVPMAAAGMTAHEIDTHIPLVRAFWRERFFTSEYCRDDVPIPGAPEFVQAALRAGAQVVYLTGRPEPMRPGTEHVLEQHGFPAPGAPGVTLLMKPRFEDHDDAFKVSAHAHVRQVGHVVAAFDNEPTHANDLFRSFPDATVVHLATDHSGRKVELLEAIRSIPDFRRDRSFG
jgi:hypothetical protein